MLEVILEAARGQNCVIWMPYLKKWSTAIRRHWSITVISIDDPFNSPKNSSIGKKEPKVESNKHHVAKFKQIVQKRRIQRFNNLST